MTLKVQNYIVDELTGTMRKVFDAMRDDVFQTPHQLGPELRECGVTLSVPAIEKLSRDLADRGLVEVQGHKGAPSFRRARIVEKTEKPRQLKAVEPIHPAAVEDRFLAICTEMVDVMAALRAENETLRSGGCTPEELATLREKAQLFDTMKQVFAPK